MVSRRLDRITRQPLIDVRFISAGAARAFIPKQRHGRCQMDLEFVFMYSTFFTSNVR